MPVDNLQCDKAKRFRDLHFVDEPLLLPNVWDPLGAVILQDLGYKAIATASTSIAFSNGYKDGEEIPFNRLLEILTRIATKSVLPVTADIESGFAETTNKLFENTKLIIETGVIGINIEDTDKTKNKLYEIEEQCDRISIVRKAARECGVPLFINARTDVYLTEGNYGSISIKDEKAILRAQAYKEAGADGIYPIGLKSFESIKLFVEKLETPVNILIIPGITPPFDVLKGIGVKRFSLASGFLKVAIQSMHHAAESWLRGCDPDILFKTNITSDYITKLIKG